MQLIIAAVIIGTVAILIGKSIARFISLEVRRRSLENNLRVAALEMLNADLQPTKISRATAEAEAKAKLKLAVQDYDASVNRFVEAKG